MAKQPTSKGGTSRIRFIMLEAEIPEGDLGQLASAIQNALKPTTAAIQQRLSPASAPSALPNGFKDVDSDIEGEVVDPEETLAAPPLTRQPKEAKPRKPTSMKVLDIDLKSDPSFESFANIHAPKNDAERNLVALAWFKEHRSNEVVTANHVYTCYRALKWPSGIEDFPSVLRSLKAQQVVNSVGRGQYEINHLGIDRVEKMGPAT
ncbi:hypothetical protein LGR54_18140 [Ancylobacter sp. Lp-2]|uniref:hypothetical protein n=1 Tax=Ancylobacter sp. Lp-2 TaxID=2881339 RepID=UPI001E496A5C|nr:hypothetical protein [Ancylobacter sp. Lp-2]MCB4770532.1 hypothetical protein [Ancylobacter sp. Lp-2]